MRRWLWLAVLAFGGCNLVTGIDDYEASLFVGEWAGETTLLSHKPSLRIFGDFSGDGVLPATDVSNGFLTVQDVGVSLAWANTDQYDVFDVTITCADVYCMEAADAFRRTLRCDVSNGGQNLKCDIQSGEPIAGVTGLKFRRSQ